METEKKPKQVNMLLVDMLGMIFEHVLAGPQYIQSI